MTRELSKSNFSGYLEHGITNMCGLLRRFTRYIIETGNIRIM